MKKVLICAVSMIACSLSMFSAAAQEFPSRPITFLVGFAPGGAVDIVARTLGAQLQEQWRQPVVIENRAGANSNVAAVAAARSKPDGYTLLVGANGMTTNMALYASPGFDVEKDFSPVSLIGDAPPVIAAGPGFSGATLQALVELAKATPGAMNYGSPGAGSSAHLMMELFQRVAGIKLQHIAYRGGQPAITDALGGHIPLLAVNLPEVIGQAQSGALKILGVPSTVRNPLLPEALTIAEQGYPGFDASTWWALFAPVGTPSAIVDRLNAEVRIALANPGLREKFRLLGGVPKSSSPKELADFITNERERWTKIILDAKIVAE
jgi:tripartite-type tricarboxylate transporter receptor subunit TctC